ncbi:hypothetical protein Hdeb2414_s0016g00494741 [Helianthus debilis subsp. tardiflorus]
MEENTAALHTVVNSVRGVGERQSPKERVHVAGEKVWNNAQDEPDDDMEDED